MYMVGHQDVSMYNATFAHSDFPQFVKVANTIDVGEEARLPIIAALDNVLRYTRKIKSGMTRHER
jgi:hypothetical protein